MQAGTPPKSLTLPNVCAHPPRPERAVARSRERSRGCGRMEPSVRHSPAQASSEPSEVGLPITVVVPFHQIVETLEQSLKLPLEALVVGVIVKEGRLFFVMQVPKCVGPEARKASLSTFLLPDWKSSPCNHAPRRENGDLPLGKCEGPEEQARIQKVARHRWSEKR